MAVAKLYFGNLNITDSIIVDAVKTTTPGIVEATRTFSPPHSTIENAILPESGEIDAGVYFINYYSSSDGTTKDLLIAQFEIDLKNKKPISEKRFYQVGGIRDADPAPDQNELQDGYLEGKNVTGVSREGFGDLVPDTYTFAQYERDSPGIIRLLNGQTFNQDETIAVTITYTQEYEDSASNNGFYNGTVNIASNTQLTSNYRNKRLRCAGETSILVLTLEDIDTVPDGKFYYIHSVDGEHKQVRLLPFENGQDFLFEGELYTEISLGYGEMVRIEKFGSRWEIVTPLPGMARVGERINRTTKNSRNAIAEDPRILYDGDELPRIWYWIKTNLPANHYHVDDAVVNNNYVHPTGKEGMFVIHSSQKKFRTPNSQGRYIRGVNNYDDLSGMYPGVGGLGSVAEHRHKTFYNNGSINNKIPLTEDNTPDRRQGNKTDINNENYEYSITGDSGEATLGKTGKGHKIDGTPLTNKNEVDYIGEIFLRCV
jgi:hypothetical protein